LIVALAVLLATAFPSNSKTSWMRPDAFHLIIGMTRAETLSTLQSHGWKTQKGKDSKQLIVIFSDDKSLTLRFERDRLHSARFELFTLLPEAAPAFEEEKKFLHEKYGTPKKTRAKSVLLYSRQLPNVIAVLADDPKSEHGRRGLGMVIVRYYDPR
jgi:hypothetical protein